MSTRTAVATPRYLYELQNECPIAWPLKAPYLLDIQTTSNADSGSSEPVTAGPAAAAASHASPSINNVRTAVDIEQDLDSLYYDCLYKRDIIKNGSSTAKKQLSVFARHLRGQPDDVVARGRVQTLLLTSDQLDGKWHTAIPAITDAGTNVEQAESATFPLCQREIEELSQLFCDVPPDVHQARSSGVDIAIHDVPSASAPRQAFTAQLADLEITELKLQILLTLEMLARTPLPEGGHLNALQLSKTSLPRKRKLRVPAPEPDGLADKGSANQPAKQYWAMAKRLDQLTDTLAIHQAVGGLALSGLFLGLNDEANSSTGGSGSTDVYQAFWNDVCDCHYHDVLASDILSGCHSKFFSSATLHGSLFASDADANEATLIAPSPFHHPTPDLRALARSVHLAEESRKANAMPQSPTLAKLLGKSTSSETANGQVASNAMHGHTRDPQSDWLLPPDASLRVLPRPARSSLSIAGHNASKNPFRSREVEMRRPSALAGGSKQREASTGFRRPFASSATTTSSDTINGQAEASQLLSQTAPVRRSKHKPPSPAKRIPKTGGSRVLVQATPLKGGRTSDITSLRDVGQDSGDEDTDATDAALRLLQPTPKAQRKRPAFMVLAGETPDAGRVRQTTGSLADASTLRVQEQSLSSTPHRPEYAILVHETPGG